MRPVHFAAGAFMAALMLGGGQHREPVVRPDGYKITLDRQESDWRNRKNKKLRGRRKAAARRAVSHSRTAPAAVSEFQRVVNSMTNWQRNQWARAGYPGLRKQETNEALVYVLMPRAERVAA